MASVEDTLAARETRYGDFSDNAAYAQGIKEIMRQARRWGDLAPAQKEALELIASKIGRLLSGDPAYADNWHDIGGYAKLGEDRLGEISCPAATTPNTSKPIKKLEPKSRSGSSATKPAMTLKERVGFTKETDSTSTINHLLRRVEETNLAIGGSEAATPTDQRGI